MKNLISYFLFFSIAFLSCQQESQILPDTKTEGSDKQLREALLPTIPKFHQLIKHGESVLSYYGDGRLKKVTYGPNVRGSYNTFATYSYQSQSIIVTLNSGGKVVQVITYMLDPATGRCKESKQLDYVPYGPNATLEQETGFTYVYNVKGQLSTRMNKKYPSEKTVLVYDANGDVVKISNYGYFNGLPSVDALSESTLYYDQPTGDPILTDLSPINCEWANISDPYLKIFGKQSKHLVKLINEKFSIGGKYFTYILNADGYVTSRKTYNTSGASVIKTTPYDYLVSEIGVNL